MSVALEEAQAALVRKIIEVELPGATVAVFGSRATGRARPFSDLDLLILEPTPLTWAHRARLREAFEASTLPFRVDFVDAASLAPGVVARVAREQQPLP